jgi:hypothetical protein
MRWRYVLLGMPFFLGSSERFFNSINVIIETLRGTVDAATDRRSEKGREGV